MTEKKKIDVTIDGRNFTVVASGDEEEKYIKHLASYVDKKIKDLAYRNERLSQTMAAILAAFNIADELAKTIEELNNLEEQAKEPIEKYGNLNEDLEEAKGTIEELEKINQKYKDDFVNTKLETEDKIKEISKLKEELELKNIEIQEKKAEIEKIAEEKSVEINKLEEEKNLEIDILREENKVLQDKNFKNNLELVETKKELSEILEIFNDN